MVVEAEKAVKFKDSSKSSIIHDVYVFLLRQINSFFKLGIPSDDNDKYDIANRTVFFRG